MTELSTTHPLGDTTDTVAGTLAPLVRHWSGHGSPVALRAWDGSRTGPADTPVTIVVHSPHALRRLLYAPGELGLARAHVAGELDFEGDLVTLLRLGDRATSRASGSTAASTPGPWPTCFGRRDGSASSAVRSRRRLRKPASEAAATPGVVTRRR